MPLPVLAFSFWYLPSGLLLAFVAALCFWVWRRTKSSGHLLMLIGTAWLAQYYVLAAFEMCVLGVSNYALSVVIGSLLFAIGFYVSVKPLVADDLARVTRWIRSRLGRNAALSAPAAAPPAPTPFFAPSPPAAGGKDPTPRATGSGSPTPEDLNLR